MVKKCDINLKDTFSDLNSYNTIDDLITKNIPFDEDLISETVEKNEVKDKSDSENQIGSDENIPNAISYSDAVKLIIYL